MNASDSITAEEAGRLLGVTRQRVYGLIKADEFPGAQRFGYMWLIPRGEVVAYAARKATAAPAPVDDPAVPA